MTETVEVAYPVMVARNLPVPVTSADVTVSTNAENVTGWSFRETTNAASAELQLIDGQSNNGDVVAEITLTPGQSIRDMAGSWCLGMDRGVTVHMISGTVRGSIWSALA
jgi:hypothetical protein